ncbi:helix-turn-helix domain-containing protein [Candidatus Venteria ishoeyi]|uniref:Uncharacterized protein n=1 Tax=Candidatus Venteria ishoeyi TaxID=1899563 RepID=A0A1H6F7T1_9GAMM|nr:hypothetical protein [Candidatus Venteria ishoeyi]SEH05379.1 Uncharacterised protein [Candidatus Venteria ishoeyi]
MKRYIAIDLLTAKQQGITLTEWALLENIHFMSNNATGYCYASKNTLAGAILVSERTVFNLIQKLTAKKFIVKNELNHLTVTDKWIAIANGNTAKFADTMQKLQTHPAKTAVEPMQNLHIKEDIKERKKRDARAIDFLLKNSPGEYESFLMQYKKTINNFKKFSDDFNDTVDQEELKYNTKVLMARLRKYARNWIANQTKFEVIKADTVKPNYLKNFSA